MICGVFRAFEWNKGEVNCWDISTGNEITAPPVRIPGKFSAGGTRIAVSEYKRPLISEHTAIFLDISTPQPPFKQRLIWDFKLRKMLARWTPRKQVLTWGKRSARVRDAFALSPSGKLYAEGGSGIVTVYRVD